MAKLQFESAPAATVYQSLRVKAGFTEQLSDETYLGLTDDDFLQNPTRRYAASAGDLFSSEHSQLQASYLLRTDGNWSAEISAYRNNFKRDWFKLQSVNGTGISSVLSDSVNYATEFAYLTGTSNSGNDAIFKRHNNRKYISQGIQAEITTNFAIGDANMAITSGVRLHNDEEDRLQAEGLGGVLF